MVLLKVRKDEKLTTLGGRLFQVTATEMYRRARKSALVFGGNPNHVTVGLRLALQLP